MKTTRTVALRWTLFLLLSGCAGTTPALRNPSEACRIGAPTPTSVDAPGWPCWPLGVAPSDASFDISNESDVPAPPEATWAWLTRADRWSSWFPLATNVHFEKGGPTLDVGTVVVWDMLGSTIRVTITRAEPPYVLAWEGGASGVHAYHVWLIEPQAKGSHVVTLETERGIVPALFGWTYKNKLKAAHDEWLSDLARVAAGDQLP